MTSKEIEIFDQLDMAIALPFINQYIQNFYFYNNKRVPKEASEALRVINEECWRIFEVGKSLKIKTDIEIIQK